MFVLAFAFRYLTLGGLGGDDHWSLWNAATFLKGDRFFQDFVDLGDPLYWAMSALAQALVGYRVIGEVVLGTALMAFAVAVAFHMAWQAGRSLPVALIVTVMVVVLISVTKLYSYPKTFVYPLGLWLSWRYIDRPTLLRAAALALGVVVAFGYRHDHGAYVGVGCAAAVLLAHWSAGPRQVFGSLCRVGGAVLVLLAPFFILVQIHEGVVSYFHERTSIAAQLDAAGRRMVPFVVDPAAPSSWIGITPPPPARVAVVWTPDLTAPTQLELEKRYSLTGRVDPRGGWHRYVLDDPSEANLAALMSNPRMASVDGVAGSFRRGWAVTQPTREGAAVVVNWTESTDDTARAGLERRYHLTNPRTPSNAGRTLLYDIGDVSMPNLNALAVDRHLQVIDGLDPRIVPVVVRLLEPLPAGPRVSVRWKPDVTDAERIDIERQHHLANPRLDTEERSGPVWRYELADVSGANATALAKSPRSADMGGLTDTGTPGSYRASEAWPVFAKVGVRWAPDVAAAEQAELERLYQLRSQSSAVGATEYTLIDAGAANIRALVSDPHVRDVSGIDRENDRPTGESWWGSLGRRVALLRLRVAPALFHTANAGVFLYYLSLVLPILVLTRLAVARLRGTVFSGMSHEAAKMFVAAVMMGVVNLALMRKLGTFADHVAAEAVLGVWLFGGVIRPVALSRVTRWAAGTLACGTMVLTIIATASYVNLSAVPGRLGFGAEFWRLNVQQFHSYATSPPIDDYAPPAALGDRALLRYLYACTRPDDRVWVTTDVYTIPYYTERRVVGHIFWGMGFLASQEQQRRTIAMLERDQVPLIVGVGGARPLQYLEPYELVHAYASKRYVEYYPILQDQLNRKGIVIWLAVDSRRKPSSTYTRLGLPCFK